jgi:hypothetical protein
MSYYIKSSRVTAVFVLQDAKRRKVAEASGLARSIEPIRLSKASPTFPPGYPLYEVVSVSGVTEAIEHRKMGPLFYVSDDPDVLRELGVTQGNANRPDRAE